MEIGIFARTFARPTLEAVLDAVAEQGISHVQFNMLCAGLPSMPERIEPALLTRIAAALHTRKLVMASLSGTYNMIHPDLAEREAGRRQLRVIIEACKQLAGSVVTLCTGTRNLESMWRAHPDNNLPDAWRDLLASTADALEYAEAYGITLVVEPEVSNVIDSAQKARRLMDEMGSPNLKVVIDGANLFHAGQLPRMREVLDEAFDLVGDDIVLAHAKDLSRDGEAGHEAAGTGLLDYDYYLAKLLEVGFAGSLILHSLTEAQTPEAVRFLRAKLQ